MVEKLAGILFKSYRRQVLTLLLLNPGQRYHVREVARLTNTVAGTVNKELAKLEQVGVLSKARQGNQVLYFANTSCLIFDELVSILEKIGTFKDSGKKATVLSSETIDPHQLMLDAVRQVAEKVDNKIQLSHAAELQKAVIMHFKDLLAASELLEDDRAYLLSGVKAVVVNKNNRQLDFVWKVIKQDLPVLEEQLINAMAK